MIFDYMTLKIIWWAILTFVLIAFAVTGGMDIGVNILLGIIGKSEQDRRLILNATGPTWEGNQVWLITFGAGLFAIWPSAYATAFSSMYFALLLVLLMLILRPPGFDYRAKIDSQNWRKMWDMSLFGGGVVLALVFGVAIGNLFLGLPFYFDNDMRVIYTGGFFDLLTLPALLFGVVSLYMLTLQGALFLQYKLEGELAKQAFRFVKIMGWAFIASFIITGIYVCKWINGYEIMNIPDLNTGFSATHKTVAIVTGGWLRNYQQYNMLWLLPAIAILATLGAMQASKSLKPKLALLINSLAIATTVLTAAAALFPFILPSSSYPDHGLTMWAVILFLPIVLVYTSWVYKVMGGKVRLQSNSY
jgi:cytochrome d ubiquinol oxidase subunit II